MNFFDRAVALTDVHFGRSNNSPVANKDNLDFIDWFVEEAKTYGAKKCFMLGDWFQNRFLIGVSTLESSLKGVEKLNDAFEEVIWIPGNHDLLYRDKRDVTSISFAKHLPNIKIIMEPTTIGGVTILPWLVGNEHKNIKVKKSRYVFGHLELPGFLMNAKVPMPVHGNGLNSDDFKNGPEYVFSGHFHFRQAMDNIVYMGNTMPFDFADVWDEERGMMFLEWGKEPFFKAWPDQPLFRTMTLSELLNKPYMILPKTTARVTLDIDISFEEAQVIKDEYAKRYGARKIELISMNKHVNEKQDFSSPIVFQTVDQMMIDGINEIKSESIQPNKLLSIYESL